MDRIEVVQSALKGRVRPLYLEIGVSRGSAFRRISADEKIGVDPAFKLSARARRDAGAKARATRYVETTSDAFFAGETGLLESRGIDVALIDGNHTYAQALRDVENTLRYLRDDGVVVVHDCNPASARIGVPAASYAEFCAKSRVRQLLSPVVQLAWSGDVWKTIVNLRSTRDDVRVAVLDCDRGVGIVRKGSADSRLSYSAGQIEALGYADLAADRRGLLNLKPPTYLDEFLNSTRSC
ncbi:class I SAM-dependent methyltransferase [Mycobacterium sp. 94-17]|uniref:class I SAM-dependent methyltransferase n=1 Tax=Mycobacterium sp. 94-17 TaxID=2986147 RepID=UPI002D1F0B9C|nr:class I SAM-dependent methyltransferase [Mycobacterium sp. 94-17]MEB4212029.1 class I SAM-dependent methyltransferase [Mycobacterium sp. 94-17]